MKEQKRKDAQDPFASVAQRPVSPSATGQIQEVLGDINTEGGDVTVSEPEQTVHNAYPPEQPVHTPATEPQKPKTKPEEEEDACYTTLRLLHCLALLH